MTKARENSDYTGLAADITAGDTAARAGRKNLILNGSMQISQRGDYTSATAITNGTFYLDRFRPYRNGVDATVQQTDVTINGVNKKAMKVAATTTSSGYIGFYQTMELQNIPVGETLTVSCWVRSNNSNTRFRSNDFRGVSVDGNAFTNDGNWEKVTWTFDSSSTTQDPTLWVMTYDAGAVSVTSGDYIEVADFQLEVGSVATDFEHRSYGEILADCQRYYYSITASDVIGSRIDGLANGVWENTFAGCPVTMRANPSLTKISGSEASTGSSTAIARGLGRTVYMTTTFTGGVKYYYLNGYTMDAEL
jgi:hypothetical protein